MPYDCIKDTTKIAHSIIIHPQKYTYNTEYFILESGGHTHIRNSQPYQLHASTHAEKYRASNSTQTDKIPTHKHLYSDQYYHINSTANPHIKR